MLENKGVFGADSRVLTPEIFTNFLHVCAYATFLFFKIHIFKKMK